MSDVLHDINWTDWLHINEKLANSVPSYVKEYTPLNKEAASKLSESQYADDIHNLFPIDSKENTWLSAAYFGINKEAVAKPIRGHVEQRIKQAAAIYDIKDDVDAAIKTLSANAPAPEADHIILKDASGRETQAFPIVDTNSLYKAAAYFDEYRFNFTPDQRREIATHIIKHADANAVELETLPRSVCNDAGYGIPDKAVLMEELLDRAQLSKDAELSMAVANINMMIGEMPSIAEEGVLNKIAEVINVFDDTTGLSARVQKGRMFAIEDVIYGNSIGKSASVLKDVVVLDKHMFSAIKLAELDSSTYSNILGDEFISKVKSGDKIDSVKLASALTDLDTEDKRALENYIKELYT